MKITTVVVCEM